MPLLLGLCFRLCRRIDFAIGGEGGGVGASVGDSSPELHSLRPYILVLPPGGDVDLVAWCIAGVVSSSDFRFCHFDFLFRFERCFLSFFTLSCRVR